MYAAHLRDGIAVAPRAALDGIASDLYRALVAGQITDADAEELQAAIDARRVIPQVVLKSPRRVGSRPRSPASLERRRSWAAAGRLPPQIASRYTPAETAVLAVVAWAIAKYGTCTLPVGQIAALAGVARSTAAAALREARANGHILSQQRPRPGGRHDTSIVTISAPEWAAWIARHPRPHAGYGGGGGVMLSDASNTSLLVAGLSAAQNQRKGAAETGNRQARRSRR